MKIKDKSVNKPKYYIIQKQFDCTISEIVEELQKHKKFIENIKWPPSKNLESAINNIAITSFNFPVKIDVKNNCMVEVLEIKSDGPDCNFEQFVEYVADNFETENFSIKKIKKEDL